MDYNCTVCKKEYSSYKSLWNHTKKYHNNINNPVNNPINPVNNPKHNPIIIQENNRDIRCRKCDQSFTFIQNRWRHEKKCDNNKIEKVEEKNKQLENKINKLEKHLIELSKTTGTKSIINLNNNGTINIVNHINSLGYENIQKNLTEKEKILLLTSMRVKEHPIIELVRMIYTEDKFKGERNTVITNLRSKECLTYNSEANKFDATAKKDHIDNIIENRRTNIVAIYKELSQNNKLRPVEIKIIDAYLEEIEDLGKKNPKVKALYEKHKAEIIYIIYNCKEFMNRLRENMPNVVEQEDSTDEENNIEV